MSESLSQVTTPTTPHSATKEQLDALSKTPAGATAPPNAAFDAGGVSTPTSADPKTPITTLETAINNITENQGAFTSTVPATEEGNAAAPPVVVDTATESYNEVLAEKVKNDRSTITISFTAERRNFRKPLQHATQDTIDTYKYFPNYTDPNYVEQNQRLERDFGVQCGTELKTTFVQTNWSRLTNKTTQTASLESLIDEEVVKKSQNDPQLSNSLVRTENIISEVIKANGLLQLFMSDFDELSNEDVIVSGKNSSQLKEVQSFAHVEYSKNKKISALDWQPKAKGIIAFACVDPGTFNERLRSAGKSLLSHVVVWNFNDPIYAQLILLAPVDVMCLRFNPSHPNLVVGGLINGQVILWDLDSVHQQQMPTNGAEDDRDNNIIRDQIPHIKWKQISLVEMSHHQPVSDVQWIPNNMEVVTDGSLKKAKEGHTYQFISIGPDGKLLIWDIRKDNTKRPGQRKKNEKLRSAWIPYQIHQVMQTDLTSELTLSAMSVNQEENTNPYGVCCATRDGEFVVADWTPSEKSAQPVQHAQHLMGGAQQDQDETPAKQTTQNITKEVMGITNGGHNGPVTSVHKHPFFNDIYLTVGDWCFKIWKVGCKKPVWTSKYCQTYYTCGRWSPTRPGVIYVGRDDGQIEVWDFMDKSHSCSLKVLVSQNSLTHMEFRAGSGSAKLQYQYVAIGTSHGTLYVLEVPRNLIKPQTSELEYMQQFFSREQRRVEYFSQRWTFYERQRKEKEAREQQSQSEAQHVAAGKEKEEEEPFDYAAMKEKFLKLIMAEEDAANAKQ